MSRCEPKHPMCEGEPPCIYCRPDDYDGLRDFSRSIDDAYAEIRQRVALGGPGWKGPQS